MNKNSKRIKNLNFNAFGEITDQAVDSNFSPFFFNFAGGIKDKHTNLLCFGAKDSDVFSGRWTANDLILFKGGDFNLFGYYWRARNISALKAKRYYK